MDAPPIPRWLAALDDRKPYVEVLDGVRQPDVSPLEVHGRLQVRIAAQLDAWAGKQGRVAAEVRFSFRRRDGKWSSVLPDVDYISEERLPGGIHDAAQRPRIAPDLAVEILSPNDRPGRMRRKIALYFEFGAKLVLVVHPMKRVVWLHRADGTVENRRARGSWPVEPFDGLVLDWETIYRNIGID